MFKENKIYKRIEIERQINPQRTSNAQSSYYIVSGTKIGVAYIKMLSHYKNELKGTKKLIWQDSIGLRQISGVEFFKKVDSVFFFVKNPDSKNGVGYTYVGEVKSNSIDLISKGELHKTPNTFSLNLSNEVSPEVKAIFENTDTKEKNIEIKDEIENGVYGSIDQLQAAEIGKRGEEIFDLHLKSKSHSYNDVIKLLSDVERADYVWLNKSEESFKPYDFIYNGLKIDVKTTVTKSKRFYLSEAEKDLIERGELNILLMYINDEWEYSSHKLLSALDVKEAYRFIPQKYIAKPIK